MTSICHDAAGSTDCCRVTHGAHRAETVAAMAQLPESDRRRSTPPGRRSPDL